MLDLIKRFLNYVVPIIIIVVIVIGIFSSQIHKHREDEMMMKFIKSQHNGDKNMMRERYLLCTMINEVSMEHEPYDCCKLFMKNKKDMCR